MKSIQTILFKPVDISSLVFLRMAFGILVVLEIIHYTFSRPFMSVFYIEPTFHFKYYGFSWVPDLQETQMKLFLFILAIIYLLFAIGFFYRIISIACFVGFSWLFLMERASYLNHWYLICLLSFLFIFIPSHRKFSVDAWRNPSIKTTKISEVWLYAVLVQVCIVYVFAAISKINADWLQGQPLGIFLEQSIEKFPEFLGFYLTEDWLVYFSAYAIIIFQLLACPFLLWKKTRTVAFVLHLFFQGLVYVMFPVGYFPHLMVVLSLLFYPADWPKKVWQKLKFPKEKMIEDKSSIKSPSNKLLVVLGIYFFFQLIIPMRQFLYAENKLWAEEGFLLSWKMMTAAKKGSISYAVKHSASDKYIKVDVEKFGLTWGQRNKIFRNPDLILQYAHHIGKTYEEKGYRNVEVYADVYLGLNGRPEQRFVHPNVDLFKQERQWLMPYKWALPIQYPLPD